MIAVVTCIIKFSNGGLSEYDVIWLFVGLYFFWRPVAIYLGAKKSFNTHQILQEEIVYDFLSEGLLVTTSYSHADIPWSKFYKIIELKNWFLIYQNSNHANFIPKKLFDSVQIIELRNIFRGIQGVKLKLKQNL